MLPFVMRGPRNFAASFHVHHKMKKETMEEDKPFPIDFRFFRQRARHSHSFISLDMRGRG